ncbi:MAG TPA: hypothetical protein DCF68_20735 [Cyanothece sp. UBA12306]|nr:hypothetical protein [Cyanothece sp. UBA12306]
MTIVFAMAVGVVMALAAGTMLIGSQAKQSQVSAENAKAQGSAVADAAVNRVIYLLQKHEILAQNDLSAWKNISETGTDPISEDLKAFSESCNSQQSLTDIITEIKNVAGGNWQDLGNNQGQYKIMDYQGSGTTRGLGTLKIQAKANPVNNNKGELKESIAQLQIQIPVKPKTGDIPGLWLKEKDLSKSGKVGQNNNRVDGDVWISDCTNVSKTDLATILDPSGQQVGSYAPVPFPDSSKLPVYDEATIPTAQKSGSTSNPSTPDPDPSPDPSPDPGPGKGKGKNKGKSFGSMSGLSTPSTGLIIDSDVTLPRPGDTSTTKTINGKSVTVYEYLVNKIDMSGNEKLKINTTNGQVILYVLGDITKGGQGIYHCDDPSDSNCQGVGKTTDFQIYGYGTQSTSNPPEICLNGNKPIEGFIFAPTYTAGAAGTGGGAGAIKGSAWLKSWNEVNGCGSNTSNTVVTQTGQWTDLMDQIKPNGLQKIQLEAPSNYTPQELGS